MALTLSDVSVDSYVCWCRCVVTKSSYTEDEDFRQADAVYDCIGDKGDERFSFADFTQHKLQASTA